MKTGEKKSITCIYNLLGDTNLKLAYKHNYIQLLVEGELELYSGKSP